MIGGKLSDKLGAARVTTWVFIGMIVAVFGVIHFLPVKGVDGSSNFNGFFACFIALFALTGVGNTRLSRKCRKFSAPWRRAWPEKGVSTTQIETNANKEAAAVLGFSAAIGAYGGFYPSYGISISATGGVKAALIVFIVYYVLCLLINWWYYSRKNAQTPC